MIANSAELASVQRDLQELNQRLRALFHREDLSHFEVHVTAHGIEKMIARLDGEIQEYMARQESSDDQLDESMQRA